MTQPLHLRRQPRVVTKFSRFAVGVGVGGLGVVAVAGVALPRLWSASEPRMGHTEAQEERRVLPEEITRTLPIRQISNAPALIVQDPPSKPALQVALTPEPHAAPPSQGALDKIIPFVTQTPPGKAAEKPPTPAADVHRTPQAEAPKPVPSKKRWELLAQPEASATVTTAALGAETPESMAERLLPPRGERARPTSGKEQTAQNDSAKGLIQPARWAIPADPLRTIYRSQTLAGQLLQAINSDIPGQVKIQLTVPVLDKFGYDTVILPKDTLIIAAQEGRAIYGTSRLGLKLEQLELPSGEIIELRATVGDEAGSNGVKGKVNNHLGKVILATGLSALLNIGVRTAVGTPGAGQFFQNPAQEAAQDIGAAVQRDATSIIDRELRIPPTITIKAGTFVTISLQENMQFNRPPLVAR